MGARPSSFRKSGGFLNGVDCTIMDYQFTDSFNGEAFKPGRDPKTKKEKFHSLYFVPEFRADGADENVNTTLFVGGADDFEISEDGHTLTPVDGEKNISANVSFAKFISSMCKAGFPETLLPEDELDFSAIIGTRLRTVQVTNVEDTKKLGKRKGKDGREYDRQDLLVDMVYDLPSTKSLVATKATGKPAPKTVTKVVNGRPNGKAVEEPIDIKELSIQAINEMVTRNKKPMAKAKFSMATLTTPLLKGNPAREDVRQYIFDDDNLQELADEGVIQFSRDEQMVGTDAYPL